MGSDYAAAVRACGISKSLREAATALNSSESAAKAAHFRARKRLAQIMASVPLGADKE